MGAFLFWVILGIVLIVGSRIFKRRFQEAPLSVEDNARYNDLRRKYGSTGSEWDLGTEAQKAEFREFKRIQSNLAGSASTSLAPEIVSSISKAMLVFGVFFIVLGISWPSWIMVDQDHSAHLKRKWFGTQMAPGQIIANEGQNGPQKRIIPPGFHPELFITLLYEVEDLKDVIVPAGKVLVITALEGADKPEGQLFASPWPDSTDKKRMLEDAVYALNHGLQKGPQPISFGPGTYRFNQYLYSGDTSYATTRIQKGEVGIVKANFGPRFDYNSLYDSTSKFFGLFPDELTKGGRPIKEVAIKARLTPKNWKPSPTEPEFRYEWLDDSTSRWFEYYPTKFEVLTRDMVREAKLVPPGYMGIWWEPIKEGEYSFNPLALQVTPFSSRVQTFNYYGGFTIDEEEGEIEFVDAQNFKYAEDQADVATDAISGDGFKMAIEYRALVQVLPEQAPYAVAVWGSWEDIENKSITPDSRSAMRNNSQNVNCLDYVRDREHQEITTYAQMWTQQLQKGAFVIDINYGEIVIPPDLRKTQTRRVIAEQNRLAWIAEQGEQDERIIAEEKRARGDQQPVLVKAKISEEAADYYMRQKEKEGQGDASYDMHRANGYDEMYGAMARWIGPQGVAGIEMLKQLKEMGVKDITPEVFYQVSPDGDNATLQAFGPLSGTILHNMAAGKSALNPADFEPASEPADTTNVPDSTGASTQVDSLSAPSTP